ncbi:MAG: hypothetical protein ACI8YQ_003425 [Polaribacter sp.]|jgi:hypothetical protein
MLLRKCDTLEYTQLKQWENYSFNSVYPVSG